MSELGAQEDWIGVLEKQEGKVRGASILCRGLTPSSLRSVSGPGRWAGLQRGKEAVLS